MLSGCQQLSAVLEQARKQTELLDREFNVAVLLLLEAIGETSKYAEVTIASKPPGGRQSTGGYVVPLQPRYARPEGDNRLSFGRAAVCDVMLPYGAVSKHHGFFDLSPAGWSVIDVGSTNGTFVDEVQLTTGSPHLLVDGAVLNFGQVSARFLLGHSFVNLLRNSMTR